MDEAAVFTIHGFCQRMLSLNAFESGMLFEQQLIEDESAAVALSGLRGFLAAPLLSADSGILPKRYMRCGMERA